MGRAGRVVLLLALCSGVLAQHAQCQPSGALPDWIAGIVGEYSGTVRNGGRMECQITRFSLQDGQLVGHYHIADTEPFDGTLSGFVPEGEDGGRFVWQDRYGSGVEVLRFSADYTSFAGSWGDAAPDPANPVWGQRGGNAGCGGAVS